MSFPGVLVQGISSIPQLESLQTYKKKLNIFKFQC